MLTRTFGPEQRGTPESDRLGNISSKAPPTPGGPWRVERRTVEGVEIVARLEQGFAHYTSLDPIVGRLQGAGCYSGVLALVDEASGAVAARRSLDRVLHRATAPQRRARRRPDRLGGPAPVAALADETGSNAA
jgi:hypothetical protein